MPHVAPAHAHVRADLRLPPQPPGRPRCTARPASSGARRRASTSPACCERVGGAAAALPARAASGTTACRPTCSAASSRSSPGSRSTSSSPSGSSSPLGHGRHGVPRARGEHARARRALRARPGDRPRDAPPGAATRRSQPPDAARGGGGLVSTAADYQRFVRMLAARRRARRRAAARPAHAAAAWRRNQLPGYADLEEFGRPLFAETTFDGVGFGLGFSVVEDPVAARYPSSHGEFALGRRGEHGVLGRPGRAADRPVLHAAAAVEHAPDPLAAAPARPPGARRLMGVRIQLCGRLAVEWDGEALEGGCPGARGGCCSPTSCCTASGRCGATSWRARCGTTAGATRCSPRRCRGCGARWARARIEGRSRAVARAARRRVGRLGGAHAASRRAAMRRRRGRAACGAARRSPSAACCPASRRRGSTRCAPSSPTCASRRSSCSPAPPRRRPRPAERAARAAVEAAPFRESAHAALIDALAAQGNAAEALRAYEDLRVLLREELGTTPGPDLARPLRGLPGGSPNLATGPGTHESGSTPEVRGAGTSAIAWSGSGRSRRSPVAARRAAAGPGSVALLEGPAGVGKTRLLSEVRRLAAERGVLTLAARGGELERDFPFGVVRQLFEAHVRRAASRARRRPPAVVFGAAGRARRRGRRSRCCTGCSG